MTYSVTRRASEIGIRMALGAQRGDILRMVLAEGLRLALAGIAIGGVGSLVVSRLLAKFLFGTTATDPLTYTLVPLLLVAVALLACYIPARRAMRLDPIVALRCGLTLYRPSDRGLPISQWCPKGIGDTPQAPAVLVVHGLHHRRAGGDGAVEGRIGIIDDHHHPHRAAAQRLGGEVEVLGRFVRDPEFRVVDGQPGDHGSVIVEAEVLAGPECRLVELDSLRAVAHREHRRNAGLPSLTRARRRVRRYAP